MTSVRGATESGRRAAGQAGAGSEPGEGTLADALVPSALAAVTIVSGLLLLVGVGADLPVVRAVAALCFMVVGVGSAPWQFLRLPALERFALLAITALAALVLLSTAMLSADLWRPRTLLLFLAVPIAVVQVTVLVRDRALLEEGALAAHGWWRSDPSDRGGVPRATAPVLAVLGAVLALTSASLHRHIDPESYGFLRVVGPVWYLGVALLLLAIVMLRRDASFAAWLCVLLVVLVMTLTPAIVYDAPRSPSTTKHVDLVVQIQRTGAISSSIAVYNAWPGFFAATAWLCDVAGISDPMRLAQYWPPLLGVLRVTALGYLVRQMTPDPRWTWTAVALAALADPIGADYFSPQSVGFVLGLLIFGLSLHQRQSPSWPRLLVIAAGATALAMEHQLSPYVVTGVLVLLTVLRQVRWVEAGVMALATVTWTGVHRSSLEGFLSFGSVGSLANLRPPQTAGSSDLERLATVGNSSHALLVGVLVLGALAFLGLLRQRRSLRPWALAAAPSVGLALVAINPYGNEGIFRATLFGLPWLAALAASYLSSIERPLVQLAPALPLLTATFLVASFALDPIIVIRPGDLAVSRVLEEKRASEPDRRVTVASLGNGDISFTLPPRLPDGFQVVGRAGLGLPVTQDPASTTDAYVERLTDAMIEYSGQGLGGADIYALWSPVSSYYDRAYAQQSQGEFRQLRDRFKSSPYWTVFAQSDGSYLFEFVPARYAVVTG